MKPIKSGESYELTANEVECITEWMGGFNAFLKAASELPPSTPVTKIFELPEYATLVEVGVRGAITILGDSLSHFMAFADTA